ncbi:SDR family oxidoreductase [Steroidobacter flavus]|uniref:SDR family oxidoreductase n=1 Tax=Steroidobacter flavus TaxID=1842136 RepID=A0ABV8SWY4_9GAMM
MSKRKEFPKPPFPKQAQSLPGSSKAMNPEPDYGEDSYQGANRLTDKKALITGADSGIGRAVALAFAREGADVVVSYLNEHEDARETQRLVESAGRKCALIPGDIAQAEHCRTLVKKAVETLGHIDILVNNAAHQMTFDALEKIPDEEWDKTLATNLSAMFYITKAAMPHLKEGASIINTASINADVPNPTLLAYATTKGAIQNFTAGLAQLLAEKGIRANTVAPGPVWTPLIPASMEADKVREFGAKYPMKRPAQPCELAPVYVMLASDESSYVSGATVAVTGGKPLL